MTTKVCFSGEMPTLKTVIEKLEQLTAEKITCDPPPLKDDEGFLCAIISSEATGGRVTIVQMTEACYELLCILGAHGYLLDATEVALQALGGTFEHASSLPAAAHQPWQIAKDWYQKK